jgi:hypothetical protein
MVEEI